MKKLFLAAIILAGIWFSINSGYGSYNTPFGYAPSYNSYSMPFGYGGFGPSYTSYYSPSMNFGNHYYYRPFNRWYGW